MTRNLVVQAITAEKKERDSLTLGTAAFIKMNMNIRKLEEILERLKNTVKNTE